MTLTIKEQTLAKVAKTSSSIGKTLPGGGRQQSEQNPPPFRWKPETRENISANQNQNNLDQNHKDVGGQAPKPKSLLQTPQCLDSQCFGASRSCRQQTGQSPLERGCLWCKTVLILLRQWALVAFGTDFSPIFCYPSFPLASAFFPC